MPFVDTGTWFRSKAGKRVCTSNALSHAVGFKAPEDGRTPRPGGISSAAVTRASVVERGIGQSGSDPLPLFPSESPRFEPVSINRTSPLDYRKQILAKTV